MLARLREIKEVWCLPKEKGHIEALFVADNIAVATRQCGIVILDFSE